MEKVLLTHALDFYSILDLLFKCTWRLKHLSMVAASTVRVVQPMKGRDDPSA